MASVGSSSSRPLRSERRPGHSLFSLEQPRCLRLLRKISVCVQVKMVGIVPVLEIVRVCYKSLLFLQEVSSRLAPAGCSCGPWKAAGLPKARPCALSWVRTSSTGSLGEHGPEVTARVTWSHSTGLSLRAACPSLWEERGKEEVAPQSPPSGAREHSLKRVTLAPFLSFHNAGFVRGGLPNKQ